MRVDRRWKTGLFGPSDRKLYKLVETCCKQLTEGFKCFKVVSLLLSKDLLGSNPLTLNGGLSNTT